ncbi:MAG: cation-translocating P-type ATPase [Candidatus Thorarchaeota archaeon]
MPESDAITKNDLIAENLHWMPLNEVLSVLGVEPESGLSEDEAKERLKTFGPNVMPRIKGPFWKVYIAPILNWLITIYVISAFSLIFIAYMFPSPRNQMGTAIMWIGVVAVNALVAIFQQFRAQKKLEALEKLSAGEARVIRDGREMSTSPLDIVPGDIVKLEQGDRVPADARIITCTNLTINEASLTGESVPADKDANAEVPEGAPLTAMRSSVFFGTYVATGVAKVVITATGGRTEIGKIQGTLGELNTGDIPLRKKVNRLAKYLGIAAVILMGVSVLWQTILAPILLGIPLNFEIQFISEMVSAGITRAMTIMPINIPLLTTIVLLTGVLAMARKGVIIRDLSAVESLGRVSVICSDKTGTMTRNQMTVKYCWDTHNLYSVKGVGYEPTGSIHVVKDVNSIETSEGDAISNVFDFKGLFRLITCGGINNDSEIVVEEIKDQGTVYTPLGDPTDAALLTLLRKSGLDETALRERYKIVTEYPFESELKRMSKVCKDGDKYVSFVKGATEVLLPRCTHVDGKDVPSILTTDLADRVRKMTNSFASQGYRVISLAYKHMDKVPAGDSGREEAETDLIYLGFTCIVDPPREGVKEAVGACHSAGINVVMITGDAAATARTIASDLGILNENSLVVDGSEIDSLSDEDFARTNVFARVNPEHKQVIVERYQDQNKVVAMTGDGVNDALALAMSDAGIAMGITGTDVAKEAADIVITDDSFASIVSGVNQGRGLFSKIRMMIYFYIAINLFESIIFFGALFINPGLELLAPWQSIYLVVTTHSFPGLALVFDRTSKRAMEEKPRDSQEIITRNLGKYMALNVTLMALGAAIVYFLTFTEFMGIVTMQPENFGGFFLEWINPDTGLPFTISTATKATVMLLTVILLVESIMAFQIRRINMSPGKSLRDAGIFIFISLIGLIYLAHLLLMYFPLAQEMLAPYGLLFFFIPLTLWDWIVCILAALPAIAGMELYKWHLRRKHIEL